MKQLFDGTSLFAASFGLSMQPTGEGLAIQDTRGQSVLINERIQARNEIGINERIGETVSPIKQTGSKG